MTLPPGLLAWIFAGIGDKEATLAWLSRAVEARTFVLALARVDPIWDPVRSDPRFQRLLDAVHVIPVIDERRR